MRERGFTAIELIMVLAIIAIIAMGATMSVFQLITVSRQNNDISTAVRHAQNTGHWISRDTLMAESVTTDTLNINHAFITLNWTNYSAPEDKHNEPPHVVYHKVYYILRSSANSLYRIERNHVGFDKDGNEIENESAYIADNINDIDYTWQTNNGTWILTIVTEAGKQNVTREYQVAPRVGATY